jgi:protein gp37
MAQLTKIEWTDSTWNPVTGCSKVSAGCAHCYAERLALRLEAMGNPRYQRGFSVNLHPDLLWLPLKWKSPRMIFVNSMSDLFYEGVPDAILMSRAYRTALIQKEDPQQFSLKFRSWVGTPRH